MDRLKTVLLPPVGNRIGIPLVDRPVTVQALSTAIVRSIVKPSVNGVYNYMDIESNILFNNLLKE